MSHDLSRDPYDVHEADRPLGVVLDEGRGSLPFALIHGEALVVCAAWALGEAGVQLVDVGTGWPQLREAGLPVVLHDALCPMTPSAFVTECLERAESTGHVVVGIRPVTDTVARVDDGLLGETVDREELRSVCSPVVLPAEVAASLAEPPGSDLAALVARLAPQHDVELVEAPPQGRRVHDLDDVAVLEALTAGDAGPGS